MASTIRELGHLQIPLEDVRKATNNFDDSNIIGDGEFGEVYRGRLLRSGKLVKIAARRLKCKDQHGVIEFWREISMLSILNHDNIVALIGFCDEQNEKIIINQRCAKGSLLMHISKESFTWIQRFRICVGVARALSYMHDDYHVRNYSVIHRNISSSTILLDKNFVPRLSGFEYSLKPGVDQKDQVLLSNAIGTKGYMDPEITKNGGVTLKSDIYSFGIVLWEVLCGRKAFIPNEDEDQRFLASVARSHYENKTLKDIIHPELRNHMSHYSLTRFSDAAYSCIKNERVHRSDMNTIIHLLENALEFQVSFDNLTNKLKQLTTQLSHLKIPLSDIILATNDFSEEYKINNGYDFPLYQTTLDHLDNGVLRPKRPVVIKHFSTEDYNQVVEHFYGELEMLTTCKHPNIVTLVGFCYEEFKMILVTEHMSSNGNLDDYWNNIKNKSLLTWEKRLKICIDVAHALKYIHCEMEDRMMIRDCNISNRNIALDENWGAKIVFDKDCLSIGKSKRYTDVYDFGLVLLAVMLGENVHSYFYHKTSEPRIETYLPTYINDGQILLMLDSTIKNVSGAHIASLKKFIEIASECVLKPNDQKPSMNVVVNELQQALLLQEENHIADDRFPPMEIQDFGSPYLRQKEYDDSEEEDCENYSDEITCGNKLKHLKIPIDEIVDVVIESIDSHSVEHYEIREVQFQRFNEDDIPSVEGKNNEGELPKRGKTVCLKQLTSRKRVFFTEVKMLSNCKHRNIATLLGFCVDDYFTCLVVDHAPNGFLNEQLKKIKDNPINLTWVKRLKICLDVAKGLKYLHYEMEDQKMIINCSIASSSIGLDENWGAKIYYFGNSMLLSRNQDDNVFKFKSIKETVYTDPEFVKNRIVTKGIDVYSFGVVLFELLCGRLAQDPIYEEEENDRGIADVARRRFNEKRVIEMIDPIIKEGSGDYKFMLSRGANKDSLETFIKIAYQCLTKTVDQRPTMKVVVEELEKALFFQENNEDDPIISLDDITKATGNFHVGNWIGKGGFGNVYRGKLPNGDRFDTIVAKRLDKTGGQGEQQFRNELQILFNYKHENVIRLVGYCDEKDEKVIVYEYASRGSLDRYLNNTRLTWIKRLNICIDVATALEFLHGGVATQASVIHRDIKTENILLNNEWIAKLADYGLSMISAINQKKEYIIANACGTEGYVDPLYRKSGFLTMESDIYSFGVVLFEILCGRSTFWFHKHEGQFLPSLIKQRFEKGKHDEVVFEAIKAEIVPKALTAFQTIAYRCLNDDRENRPTAKEVVEQLKKTLKFQTMTEAEKVETVTRPLIRLRRLKIKFKRLGESKKRI